VLDEVVDELVPDSIRGPEKKNLIMFTGFVGGDMTDYESLTIDRTLLSGRGSSGVLHTSVIFKDKSCNAVIRAEEKTSQ
jgi:hypothetical protein